MEKTTVEFRVPIQLRGKTMSERPQHMHQLSAIWWEMVDGMTKNGWEEEHANRVVEIFFNDFGPLPRHEVRCSETKVIE